MPRNAQIKETCPECHVKFAGSYATNPDKGTATKGKICPNGHWTSLYKLNRIRYAANPFVSPEQLPKDVLRDLGVKRPADAVGMSLATMLDCYERLLATAPKNSLTHALIEGAFGKAPHVARKVLEIA